MDCNGINQRIREFDSQHGHFICRNGWILFEDGAMREINVLGALISPPKDPRQKARNIVNYYQEKLNLAVEEFDCFKLNHMIHAKAALKQKTAPAPLKQPESVIRELRQLKKKVNIIRTHLRKALVELDEHTPQRVRDIKAMSNRNQEAAEQLLTELESIEI